ncbi:MAG: hypothetical protein WBA16_04435 [Nonlabens sp.]
MNYSNIQKVHYIYDRMDRRKKTLGKLESLKRILLVASLGYLAVATIALVNIYVLAGDSYISLCVMLKAYLLAVGVSLFKLFQIDEIKDKSVLVFNIVFSGVIGFWLARRRLSKMQEKLRYTGRLNYRE